MRQNLLTSLVFLVLIALFGLSANGWRVPWAAKAVHGSDWCEPHRTPLSTCGTCNPKLARGGTTTVKERAPRQGECANTLVRIHLGPGVAAQAGLVLATAEMRELAEVLRANAETMYAPGAHARVGPRAPGIVREVKAVLGDDVGAGALLALVESTELGQAKAELLQALALLDLREKTHGQEKVLAEKKITPVREALLSAAALEEARISFDRASQKLLLLGLSPEQVKEAVSRRDVSPVLELRAPFAGRVVEALAVPGEAAAVERPLFAVAALERMWISIDVPESELPKLEKGQKAAFFVDGLPGKRFPGKLAALGAEVDERTRTVRAFADVKNVDGLLRARMFGRAELTVKPPGPRLLVPRDAVQNDGDCHLVFVSPSTDAFQARKVELGTIYEAGCEILAGLVAGDRVATTGSFLLKTEVMRGQIGAG